MNYFSPTKQALFNTQFFKKEQMPQDIIALDDVQYKEVTEKLNTEHTVTFVDGAFVSTKKLTSDDEERGWRNFELDRADTELYKVQDSDPKAVGSVADWRTYRKELRAWPEHKDFPNKEKRPVSPDA